MLVYAHEMPSDSDKDGADSTWQQSADSKVQRGYQRLHETVLKSLSCRLDPDRGAEHQPVAAGARERHLSAHAAVPSCPIQVSFCLRYSPLMTVASDGWLEAVPLLARLRYTHLYGSNARYPQ